MLTGYAVRWLPDLFEELRCVSCDTWAGPPAHRLHHLAQRQAQSEWASFTKRAVPASIDCNISDPTPSVQLIEATFIT